MIIAVILERYFVFKHAKNIYLLPIMEKRNSTSSKSFQEVKKNNSSFRTKDLQLTFFCRLYKLLFSWLCSNMCSLYMDVYCECVVIGNETIYRVSSLL